MRLPILVLIAVGAMLIPRAAPTQSDPYEEYTRRAHPASPEITASPSGRILVEHLVTDYEKPRQIRLRDAAGGVEPALLYEYQRSAEAVFSPDERWIAVNDYAGSNVAEVRLFRRISGLKFREEPGADATGACWRLLHRANRIPAAWSLGHMYAEAVMWAAGSQALLLRLWGHE